MGAVAFLVLFFLGLLLALVGSIVGIVDAFRVSPVWGLLSLFIPFALLVFSIKFWGRKWARNGLIMSLAGLGSMLLSLPFLRGFVAQQIAGRDSQLESESFPTEPVPSEGEGEEVETLEPSEGEDELFQGGIGESILPGLPSAFEIARAELQLSTDPNERLKEISRDRSDPYAYVPVPPPLPATPPAPEDSPDSSNGPPGTGAAPQGPNASAPQNPNASAPQDSDDDQPSRLPPIDPLPELPEPVASQVEVSGVVQISGETYAIVTAPGEPASRYVKAGDRLSGGTILVKRIENRPGIVPVVILEERGTEIALPVGSGGGEQGEETAIKPPQSPSDVAALPFLP